MSYIKEQLSHKQSKTIRDDIVHYIYEDPKRMEELMECFFTGAYRINQYASWPVGIIGQERPELIEPYLTQMIDVLESPAHDAIVRNTIRILQWVSIPEALEGRIYDYCFQYLNDTKKPVAIRVFAMSVLTRLAMKYPELKEELIQSIERYYPDGSPGYQSRAKKEINRLKKGG